jgi:hypothetical protein
MLFSIDDVSHAHKFIAVQARGLAVVRAAGGSRRCMFETTDRCLHSLPAECW